MTANLTTRAGGGGIQIGSHPHGEATWPRPTISGPAITPCRDPSIGIRHAFDL